MARLLLASLLLSTCAFAGTSACGPNDQKWTVEAKAVSDFKAPVDGDHATIVFLHDSLAGLAHDRIGLDGQWKAATAHNTFAAFQTDPGDHTLCVGGKKGMTYRVNAKAGQVYFIGVVQPVMFSLTHLAVLQEDNALNQMGRMKLAVSHPKN